MDTEEQEVFNPSLSSLGEKMENKDSQQKPESSGNIQVGGNVGAGAAIGSNASVTASNIAGRDLNIGTDAKDVADTFSKIYAAIEAKTFASKEQENTVRDAVKLIEGENAKGNDANEPMVKFTFNSLAQMAPDILDVVVASLVSPVTGISAVVKKIAEKAKSASPGKS